ncbi:MAG TPA: hypothetical protein VGJ20_31690 [Xanthobacteraceae bacterium]|jgi:hypothetical protein
MEALYFASVMLLVRPNIRRALNEINSAIVKVDAMIGGSEGQVITSDRLQSAKRKPRNN